MLERVEKETECVTQGLIRMVESKFGLCLTEEQKTYQWMDQRSNTFNL